MFQLIDDMLDFISTSEVLGKPAAADLKLGLATAPVLFASEMVCEVRVVRRIFMFYLTFVWSLMLVPRVRTNDYEKIFWQGRCRCGTQPSQIGKNAYVNGSFPLYTAGTCFGLQSDGIHKTLLLAQQFGKAAVQNVKNLPESLERTALEAIVDDVLTRTK